MSIDTQVKKEMYEALERLLEKSSFKDISVNDILQECQLSRSTFYRHFPDKYALASWGYEYFVLESLRRSSEKQYMSWDQQSLETLQYIYSKRNYFEKLSDYVGQNSIEETIRETTIKSSTARIKEIMGMDELPSEIDFMIRMSSSGLAAMIVQWIRNHFTITPEEFARLLNQANPIMQFQCYEEKSSFSK